MSRVRRYTNTAVLMLVAGTGAVSSEWLVEASVSDRNINGRTRHAVWLDRFTGRLTDVDGVEAFSKPGKPDSNPIAGAWGRVCAADGRTEHLPGGTIGRPDLNFRPNPVRAELTTTVPRFAEAWHSAQERRWPGRRALMTQRSV